MNTQRVRDDLMQALKAFKTGQGEMSISCLVNAVSQIVDEMEATPKPSGKLPPAKEFLTNGILGIATECNCRAEHGAEGKEHLLFIEKMLRELAEFGSKLP